jgi:hypothetical protein
VRRGRVEKQIKWQWLGLMAAAVVKAARDYKETVRKPRGDMHGTRGKSDRVAVAVAGGGRGSGGGGFRHNDISRSYNGRSWSHNEDAIVSMNHEDAS